MGDFVLASEEAIAKVDTTSMAEFISFIVYSTKLNYSSQIFFLVKPVFSSSNVDILI